MTTVKASAKKQSGLTKKPKQPPKVELRIGRQELTGLREGQKLALLKEKLFQNTKVAIVRESELPGGKDVRLVLALQTTPVS